jgi:peptide/nickel transport system permease protein
MTEQTLPKALSQPARPFIPRNWSLIIGGALVCLVFIFALFGPSLAPKDPMKNSYVVKHKGVFIRPPFPPGAPGYPLGSDETGRDILSRLIWGIRPTMTFVLVVAALRLVIGITAGILSGWSGGRLGRLLDTIISNALAIPVLFVSLCVIAALANRWGVWAFILGLLITGWAEVARLVQEQTRLVKTQPFVEATRAMGANSGQMILSHVIPHIMPLMWIQMAFEVSSSLLTAAALGFLGYYINAVWVPTDSDFVVLRASGVPELAQMLGISLKQPWTAVSAGSLIFLIILAFNILGEGLRIQMNPERRRRRAESKQIVDRAGNWVSERVYSAVSEWRQTAISGGVFSVLLVVILGGGWFLWSSQNSRLEASKIKLPGDNLWADELHDAQGTYWTPSQGPVDESLIWKYIGPGYIVGGPVIDGSGNLYLTVKGRKLVVVGREGRGKKIIQLSADPVGWPALTAEGSIVVADENGNLSSYHKDGTLLWQYISDPPGMVIASPIVGPSGNIYYPQEKFLVAVSPNGERLWQILLPTYSFTSPLPRLSVDGKYLFFEDYVVDAETGKSVFEETTGPADKYLVGANGNVYFRTTDTFMEWQTTEKGAVMLLRAQLDANALNTGTRFPFDAGISPSGNPWLLYSNGYSSGFEYMRLIWTDPKGYSPQVIDFPYRVGRLIGIDQNGIGYVCGILEESGGVECRAVELSSGSVLWKTQIEGGSAPMGGALIEGRLYVAMFNGDMIAIGR